MTRPSNTFCVLPFVGMNVHIDGGLAPCCYQSHDDVTHRFDHYPEWRTQGLVNLKKNLLAGEKDPRCTRCWDLENNGVKSYRQQWNDIYKNLNIQDQADQSHDLRFLHLDFDNFCNLRCIMCHPTVSSSIEAEYKMHKEAYAPFVSEPKLMPAPWHATERWEELLTNIKSVDNLILTGGEPLINPMALRLLRALDLSQVNLIVTTNATQIRSEVYDLLASARSCQITVSLEGMGAHNEYLRYGSDWKVLEKNIAWLSGLPNYRWLKMNINHTLQATSAWALMPLIRWCMENQYNFNINTLDFPPYLTLAAIPDDLRHKLIDDLVAIRPQIVETYTKSQESLWIDNAISELRRASYVQSSEQRFRSYVAMLDSIRGTDFAKTFGVPAL